MPRILPAMPWPVTRPMRALISWIAASGEAKQHHPGHRVAELRAGLRIGGDPARIVVRGAGDQARSKPCQAIPCASCGRRRGVARCGPPTRGSERMSVLVSVIE